ncbi:MAG: hypothetical protein H0V66_00030 [Bdellovibrionales bacterium]|nr:hypothetical protein [Bdellovibrionales bacterium]
MRFLSCLVLLALISCGSANTNKNNMDSAGYRTSGVEQYFLPELPQWANASAEGGCLKSSSFIYLNFPKLKESYQLKYQQMIELQAQYNERLENYFRSTAVRFLKPMEEASFFSNTLEQVRGGVRSMKLPPVKEIEVIWLESFTIAELKKLAQSERFNERLPVLFSSCHSKQSLTQWLAQEQLDEVGFYPLSAEWLSPYNSQGELKAGLKINLAEVFGPNIKITITAAKNKSTTELYLP